MNQFIRRSSSLTDVSFAQALHSETRAPLEGAEGFGCPDEYKCNRHCQSVGYRGGYCDFWTLRRRFQESSMLTRQDEENITTMARPPHRRRRQA